MGDTPKTPVSKCRTPDQWINLEYRYDDLERNPVANMPFEVVCQRDPSITVRGTTDAAGKAHVTGLIPGPVDIRFQPDSDAAARQQATQLRKELKQSLDNIIAGIEQGTRAQEQLLREMNLAEKGLVYTGAFLHGVWEGATEFVDFIEQAAPILKKMGLEYLDIWRCIVTGDIDALEQKLRDARAAGHEIASSTQANLENLFLLLSDPDVRQLLYAFPERYWNAHSSVDKTHMAGSLGSDLIVALVIGAVTGGAGTAATVGKVAAKGGVLAQKAMGQLADLARAMKKIKPKLQFQGNTKSTRKMTVPKTRPNNPLNDRHASNSNKPGVNGNGDACSAVSKTCVSGEPVSMITGEELLEQTDFVLPGLIPLAWKRLYRTSNARQRGLGFGWTYPACETLQVGNDSVIYEDAEGRRIEFPLPQPGQFTTNSAEGLILHRDWHTVFYLKQPGQPDKLFTGRHTLRLAALLDSAGNRWDCFYDTDTGLISRMEASWGPQLHFVQNRSGYLDAVQQHLPGSDKPRTLARYHYSAEHDLIAVEDAGGDAEHFQYHQHILVRRTLRTGFSFYFEWTEYSPRARCRRQYGDDPGTGAIYDYRFEWDAAGRVSRSIDSNGGVLQIHYNARGQVEQEIDPLGHVTRFEYDDAGRLIQKTDPLGQEWRYCHDAIGNLTAQLDPAGGGFTLLYDDAFRLTEYADALGNTWRREYNAQGLVEKTVDAEGNATRYYYNEQGLPEIIVDAAGHKHLLVWAANGTLQTRVHEQGEPLHYRYDSAGQLRAVEQAGRITRYRYDAKGDVIGIHYPDGGNAKLAYNANRQLVAFTDALGRTTRFDYDGLAQIVRRTDPAGRTLEYQYDRERNLIGLRNEKGERYILKYDASERLIEEIGFDGRVQQYEYNPLGQLIAHIEGRHDITAAVNASVGDAAKLHQLREQNTTRFQRDPLGRLLQKNSPDGDNSVFSYDRNGRLASAINRHRNLAFDYTANGQLRAETQDGQCIEHDYDALGNRTGTRLPGGQQLDFAYNPQGLFTALDFNGQNITRLERNALGQEVARSQGQLHSGYEYDPAGRLTRHWAQHHNAQPNNSRPSVIDRRYQYDAAGRLQGVDDLRRGSLRYVYDTLDHLKAVEGYAAEQFGFDPAGNILAGQSGSTDTAPGNRLQFHGDRHFTYDTRGNRVEEKRGKHGALVTRFHYNAQNQLVKVEKGGQTFAYAYDALGRRVRKQDTFGDTEFMWNGDVLLSERRQHIEKIYLYEPGSFRPLAFIENNQCYFYQLDHLGTPQEMTDWDGRVVWSVRYRAYGNVLTQEVEKVENNLRFQGQYFDEETGLHYNRFRYYDPIAGQFTQQDPIGLLGGINNYQYAVNSTGWVDPLGLKCKENTWNEFQKDHKGQFKNSTDAAAAYKDLKANQSPWPYGFDPNSNVRTMQPGETFNMIVDNGKENMPGKFATQDAIPDAAYGRQNLAIKESWKPTLDNVVTYRVKKPFEVYEGPVGPQIDGGTYLKGGGSQITFKDQNIWQNARPNKYNNNVSDPYLEIVDVQPVKP